MSTEPNKKLQLLYTLFCDDVRLEAGNKLSFMGVFQNIMVQQLPVSLIQVCSGESLARAGELSFRSTYPYTRSTTTHRRIATDEIRDRIRRFRRQHQFLCECDFPEIRDVMWCRL